MAKITKIEGIGAKFATQLSQAGVNSVEGLLKAGASPADRRKLADLTGIQQELLLEWINHADLFRIKGIGEEFSDLLEEAGVDTVVELSRRNAENLYNAMVETNTKKKLVRRLPSKEQVAQWIEQAKNLPRVISY